MELPLPTPTAPEPLPIWMAALLASDAGRAIQWHWAAGSAIHTNCGLEIEILEPFGIPLQRGESVIVTWLPGDTQYTVELRRNETGRAA